MVIEIIDLLDTHKIKKQKGELRDRIRGQRALRICKEICGL